MSFEENHVAIYLCSYQLTVRLDQISNFFVPSNLETDVLSVQVNISLGAIR